MDDRDPMFDSAKIRQLGSQLISNACAKHTSVLKGNYRSPKNDASPTTTAFFLSFLFIFPCGFFS